MSQFTDLFDTLHSGQQMSLESWRLASIRLPGSGALAASTSGLRRSSKQNEQGGGFVNIDVISFRLRKAIHPTRPTPQSILVWVDERLSFLVAEVTSGGEDDPVWKLDCESITGQ